MKDNAAGVFETSFDDLLVSSIIESVREDVYCGVMSPRDGFSAVAAVLRYMIDPETSNVKDECILYGLMELLNSLEYQVLSDDNYGVHDDYFDWDPIKVDKLRPAPYGFKGGAVFVPNKEVLLTIQL